MIFFQWATLPAEPPGRQHAAVTFLVNSEIRLCMSPALFGEIRSMLTRPELAARFKTLTPEHVADILDRTVAYADWYETVPNRFSLPAHPKDDHLFNLAIEAQAQFLVTWETRLLAVQGSRRPEAEASRGLAPNLKILNPIDLAREIAGRRK
jgi:putative PIN family toxin of toxin-antitoxin system